MYKKACQKGFKVICVLLAVVLLYTALPMNVLAQGSENSSTGLPQETEVFEGNNNTPEDQPAPEEEPIVQEEDTVVPTEQAVAEFSLQQEVIEQKMLAESYVVAFDPDDGTSYKDFVKVTVPAGSTVSKPSDPVREGYIFKGWYASIGADGPVFWNFETNIVEENTTLWAAWEKGCIVAFDPDDQKAGYNDFFKVTVPVGSTVTSKPSDPVREGYLFKGWYAFEDANGPVFWNFETETVEENTTLWAAWEKGCIVAFDPDDQKAGYNDFFKVTVPVGSTVTSKPSDPVREGYLFKGWYAFEDANGPVFWNFETNIVEENTTLWAAWEKGCIVAFDPDDGTGYEDFFKVTVPVGSTVGKPSDPVREGYIFKGWYAFLDGDTPIFWNFGIETVEENTTLWAAWVKDTGNGGTNGGSNGGSNGGGSTNGGGITGRSVPNPLVIIEDEKIPKSTLVLDDIPKTGDNGSTQLLLWLLCGASAAGMLTLLLPRKRITE